MRLEERSKWMKKSVRRFFCLSLALLLFVSLFAIPVNAQGNDCMKLFLETANTKNLEQIPQENLNLWLKADTGVEAKEGKVNAWKNQAGEEEFTLVNGTDGITLKSSQNSGYHYLEFDGSNALKGTSIDYNGKKQITLIVVGEYEGEDPKKDSYADMNTAIFWKESAGWGSMSLAPYKEQVMMRFGVGNDGSVSRFNRMAPCKELTVNTAIKNGSTHSLVINGKEVLNETGKKDITSGIGADAYIGMGISNNTNCYFKGKIAEIIAYDRALSPDETTKIYEYLGKDSFGGCNYTAIKNKV